MPKNVMPDKTLEAFTTQAFASVFTPDISNASMVQVTLTGLMSQVNSPTGRTFGVFTLSFVQNATGGNLVGWNTTDYPDFSGSGWTPNLAANSVSSISFYYDSNSSKWRPFASFNGDVWAFQSSGTANGNNVLRVGNKSLGSDANGITTSTLTASTVLQSPTIQGSTSSGGTLTLTSTSNATKGKILFGTSAYDQVNNRLGIGNNAPGVELDVTGSAAVSTAVTSPTHRGATTSGGNMTLQSTSNATKGKILFGTSAYDEVNNRLGIANSAPGVALDVTGAAAVSTSVTTPTVSGSSSASGTLTLGSTSNATKGKILFGTSAYDEVNNRLGVSNASPAVALDVTGSGNITSDLTVPTIQGSSSSGGTLTLKSTTNATKGKVLFGTSAYDEVNNRLGIANSSPTAPLDVTGAGVFSSTVTAADPTASTHLATKNYVDQRQLGSLVSSATAIGTTITATGMSISSVPAGSWTLYAYIPVVTVGTTMSCTITLSPSSGPTVTSLFYNWNRTTLTTTLASSSQNTVIPSSQAFNQSPSIYGTTNTAGTYLIELQGGMVSTTSGTISISMTRTGGTSITVQPGSYLRLERVG